MLEELLYLFPGGSTTLYTKCRKEKKEGVSFYVWHDSLKILAAGLMSLSPEEGSILYLGTAALGFVYEGLKRMYEKE